MAATASGTVIQDAIAAVSRDANWVQVGIQLNQLRTRPYSGLCLRRDQRDLEIVPMYGWSGNLRLDTIEEHLDWAHSVVSRLKDALGKFTLDEWIESEISSKLSQLPPIVQNIAASIVDLNKSVMPNTTLLAIDSDGLNESVKERFDQGEVRRLSADPRSVGNRPVTYAAVVDGVSYSVHGHNDWYSLDLPELNRSLPFLARNI